MPSQSRFRALLILFVFTLHMRPEGAQQKIQERRSKRKHPAPRCHRQRGDAQRSDGGIHSSKLCQQREEVGTK